MLYREKIFKKVRKKFKKIKNKYETKLKNIRNKYTCILTHDIKTPLLAQNQTLKLLCENHFGELNVSQKEILEEIIKSSDFLLEVISNAIFIARYENEKPVFNIEKVNLLKEVHECCEKIKYFAQDKGQKINIKANKNIKIQADKKLTQKIIYNIISGAIFCGFENSDIEIRIKEDKNNIAFLTKNKSIYMTQEKIKSLFEDKKNLCDFNQLGMSLNLNIASKLISAHKWEIIAKSQKNNSTVFGFAMKKN